MPNCKLIWGSSASHNLTLEVGRRGLQTTYRQEKFVNVAASGKRETINQYGIQEMEIDVYITEDLYRDAVAWWAWARQGKTFAFANSASDTGNTTLASAASASDTSISVAAAAGFAASDTVLIRSATSDNNFELAKISAISASTVTLTTGVHYAYTSGSIFRHADYWGSCIMLDTTFNPRQTDAGFYNHTLRFTESL
jgi:hypothetical protein